MSQRKRKRRIRKPSFQAIHIFKFVTKDFFLEKLRDLKIQLLPTLKDDKFALELYQELKQKNPEHIPLLLAELKRLNEVSKSHYEEILQLSQKIVEIAKPNEVLQHLGIKNDANEENLLKKE